MRVLAFLILRFWDFILINYKRKKRLLKFKNGMKRHQQFVKMMDLIIDFTIRSNSDEFLIYETNHAYTIRRFRSQIKAIYYDILDCEKLYLNRAVSFRHVLSSPSWAIVQSNTQFRIATNEIVICFRNFKTRATKSSSCLSSMIPILNNISYKFNDDEMKVFQNIVKEVGN